MSTCIRRPHSVWTTCRCEDCRRDMRRMNKLHRAGCYRRITSERANTVIAELTAKGWTPAAISSATGVHPRVVAEAVTVGGDYRFGPRYSLAIVNHGEPTRGYVSAIGSCRRLQALALMGWALDDLTKHTDVGFSTLAAIREPRTKRVRPDLAKRIADLFERLCMTPGPSRQARTQARRKGYVPALAWEDIDDPDEVPVGIPTKRSHQRGHDDIDPVVVELLLQGQRVESTRAEREAAVVAWVASGGTERALCDMHGWKAGRYKVREVAA